MTSAAANTSQNTGLPPASRNASDRDFLKMIDSLKFEQDKDRAILTATIPLELLRELTSPDTETTPTSAPDEPIPAAPASH